MKTNKRVIFIKPLPSTEELPANTRFNKTHLIGQVFDLLPVKDTEDEKIVYLLSRPNIPGGSFPILQDETACFKEL